MVRAYIKPGGALRSEPHARGSMEHLTVLDGELKVILGAEEVVVARGATARYAVDVPHSIVNDGSDGAHALLVVLT